MGNDTKWADVAHYYTRSKLTVVHSIIGGPNGGGTMQAAFFELDGYALDAARVQMFRAGEYKPILRHRDDMTEADAICIWESVKGRVDFSMSVFGLYGNPREMYKTKFPLWRAEEFHWLISHGFDMFGLIESGQAIRKEAGNG